MKLRLSLPILIVSLTSLAWGDDGRVLEPADTSSPRATLNSFILSCEEAYAMAQTQGTFGTDGTPKNQAADRAIQCLDVSEVAGFVRDQTAIESALYLKEVLDRIQLPEETDIPGEKEVIDADGQLTVWRVPHTEIEIRRIEEGPRKAAYLFSPDTVNRAPHFYKKVRHLPYQPNATEGFLKWRLSEPSTPWISWLVHRLPSHARARIGGLSVWQWVGFALTIGLGLLMMGIVYRLGRRFTHGGPKKGVIRYLLTLVYPVLAMCVPLWMGNFMSSGLNLTGSLLVVTTFILNIIFLIAAAILIMGIGRRITELVVASPKIQPQSIDAQLIRMIGRLLTMAAAVVVFLEGGKHLGIPMSTLLAGAGVGGLALALGAQDAIKNIVGSVMIMLDKPYQVGERIKTKNHDGVVEEIGMRSTKLRLLSGHLTSIPNEQMATSDIENIGRRPHIRRVTDIPLPFDIGHQKAERAGQVLRELLKDHPGSKDSFPPRVFLHDFARDHLSLRFIYWYHPPNYWDYVAYGEELNKQILEAFANEDIAIALPASTHYLGDKNSWTDLAGTSPAEHG